MMLSTIAAVVLAVHIAAPPSSAPAPLVRVQGCSDGYDLDIYGRCLPNGAVPREFQAARQGSYGRRRHPVPCGTGTDLDIRDNQCHPNGTVPHRFQAARQHHW
jgi:hypothetical protein